MEGFRIGGKVVNNIRYADDTVILAESEQQLQQLINTVVTESELKGLCLNSTKSFTMVFSKAKVNPACSVSVHGNVLGQVQSFVYLGSLFSSDARSDKEIRRRIGIAKSTFTSTEHNIDSQEYYHRSTSESTEMRYMVNIRGDMIKKLEALENWFYRRMLRISWKEKVTNVEVYRRMNTSTSLLIDIVYRQLTFLGHILRKGELENLVVTGFVDGNWDRGRQWETFLTYLSKIVGKSPLDLINLAKKRDVWTKFFAHSNLRLRIWYTMMMMMMNHPYK